jgi:hypothetical protein
VTDFISDANYQPGEIVPLCGCTIDVFVHDNETLTIGGKAPADWSPSRLVAEDRTAPGVKVYRLALWAGDRVQVQPSVDLRHQVLDEPIADLSKAAGRAHLIISADVPDALELKPIGDAVAETIAGLAPGLAFTYDLYAVRGSVRGGDDEEHG